MGFYNSKLLFLSLLQLSYLTVICFAQPGDVADAPAANDDTIPTVLPPGLIGTAVRGVVLCKDCSIRGIDTLSVNTPIKDAKVVLNCKYDDGRQEQNTTAKTDAAGHFFTLLHEKAPAEINDHCKVYLGEVPAGNPSPCTEKTDLHGGVSGAEINQLEKLEQYYLFTVGPFAFEPTEEYCDDDDEHAVPPTP